MAVGPKCRQGIAASCFNENRCHAPTQVISAPVPDQSAVVRDPVPLESTPRVLRLVAEARDGVVRRSGFMVDLLG